MKKLTSIVIAVSILSFQSSISFSSDIRDYFNYELKDGHKVVYRGQTNDLYRRTLEHARDGKIFTHIKKVGNAKTLAGSIKAERKALATYRKNHKGQNPKYNQTNHG